MLTRPAQEYWHSERVRQQADLKGQFERPDFIAIYIPSDIRWSYELEALSRILPGSQQNLANRIQRTLVACTSVTEAINTFQDLLGERHKAKDALALGIAEYFDLKDIVPSLGHIRLRLSQYASTLRYLLTKKDFDGLSRVVDSCPPSFSAHALDPLIECCTLYGEMSDTPGWPARWALCFDELEIAPKWLQQDLLSSFRSTDQRFLLKCTWVPVLPSELQEAADVSAIRIWHSHVADAKMFCREFSTRLIRGKLGIANITPQQVFGRSLFAEEERAGENEEVYEQGSEIWTTMVELAKRDKSFASYLSRSGLDPRNPVSDNTKQRDESLRKIKPIVLLRETFSGAERARTRKRPALYAGEDAIYAMSDGNPRWLAGLLNDLLDLKSVLPDFARTRAIPATAQAPVLRAASERMRSYIRDYPHEPSVTTPIRTSLYFLIEHLAAFFQSELLGDTFQGDPAGSVVVDAETAPELINEVKLGLLNGALIYVGTSHLEVPTDIFNARLRLSFMLSPCYKLLFRNYRPISLSAALRKSDPRQLEIFEEKDPTS
jgi:hypothetical protein